VQILTSEFSLIIKGIIINYLLFIGRLLGLLFGSENGGSTFLRNICKFLSNYTISRPQNSTQPFNAVRTPNSNTEFEDVCSQIAEEGSRI
jgi:hypothetical protein